MTSIKEQAYSIPRIYATGYQKTFSSGANAPSLVSGMDMDTQIKGEFVVKLKAGETMNNPTANLKELLAAFIAMELNIPVAIPVLVEVTKDFIDTITDDFSKQQAQKSIGLNFGSVYLKDGYTTLLPQSELATNLIPYAHAIFCFDMLIQNIDRTKEKPNMLTTGKEIVAIDHEKGFSFIYTIFSPINIWEMSEGDKKWIQNHILQGLIKGKSYNFEEFVDNCTKLDDDFWNKALLLTPNDWKTDHFYTIKDRINSFISYRNEFIKELKIITA